jgi:hypothetical protein
VNWLTIVSLVVGPGGILAGGFTWLQGRRKSKVDNAVALNSSTLSYAAELRADLAERDKRDAELVQRVYILEQRLNARDAAVIKHMPWDWHVYRALNELGHPVEEPPPLLPVEQF